MLITLQKTIIRVQWITKLQLSGVVIENKYNFLYTVVMTLPFSLFLKYLKF